MIGKSRLACQALVNDRQRAQTVRLARLLSVFRRRSVTRPSTVAWQKVLETSHLRQNISREYLGRAQVGLRMFHVPRSDALEDLCFNSGQVANAVTEICPLNPQTQESVHLNARSVSRAQKVHLLGNARTAGVSWSRAFGCRMTPRTAARPLLA